MSFPLKSNADVVREACHVVWTEGQIDRIEEFYAADFSADYAFTAWGFGIEGATHLRVAAEWYYLTTSRKYHYAPNFRSVL